MGIAVGFHVEPFRMVNGPLGDYGWIGETEGSLSLFCPLGVNSGDSTKLRSAGEFQEVHGSTCDGWSGSTLVVTVNHDTKTVTWTGFRSDRDGPTHMQSYLPETLVG